MEIIENVIIITVPEGTNKLYLSPDGFYMRRGTLAQKMTREEIIASLQNEGQLTYDDNPNYDAKYPSSFSISRYNEYLTKAHLTPSSSRDDTLINLHAAVKQADNNIYLTNAGSYFSQKNLKSTSPMLMLSVLCTHLLGHLLGL